MVVSPRFLICLLALYACFLSADLQSTQTIPSWLSARREMPHSTQYIVAFSPFRHQWKVKWMRRS